MLLFYQSIQANIFTGYLQGSKTKKERKEIVADESCTQEMSKSILIKKQQGSGYV